MVQLNGIVIFSNARRKRFSSFFHPRRYLKDALSLSVLGAAFLVLPSLSISISFMCRVASSAKQSKTLFWELIFCFPFCVSALQILLCIVRYRWAENNLLQKLQLTNSCEEGAGSSAAMRCRTEVFGRSSDPVLLPPPSPWATVLKVGLTKSRAETLASSIRLRVCSSLKNALCLT